MVRYPHQRGALRPGRVKSFYTRVYQLGTLELEANRRLFFTSYLFPILDLYRIGPANVRNHAALRNYFGINNI
jgi:hypothetical protein